MITVERVAVLRRVELFAGVPGEVLAAIATVADEVAIGAGDVLLREGDHGDQFFVIVSGCLAASVQGRRVAELGPGDVVGEFAVLVPESRSATVTAVDATSLLRIDKSAMDELLLDYPEVGRGIITALVRRFQQHNRNLARKMDTP